MNPLQGQVGGTHYVDMGMQPFEFTMANQYDALAHTTLKYVSRHATKAGKADLEKAKHCVFMRLALMENPPPAINVISISRFCEVNGLPKEETQVLEVLHHWARCQTMHDGDDTVAKKLAEMIDALILKRYPDEGKTDV